MSAERICALEELTLLSPRRFMVSGTAVCVVRFDDDLYAIDDTCSHADVSLSEGEVDPDTRDIECWKHGSCFSLRTGEPDTLPAYEPVPTYKIWTEGDDVLVQVEA